MRENIEQFSVMEEHDMFQKIMAIADKCYPNECYDNTFCIRLKKLSTRHLSTLEHGNVIFEVSHEIYKNVSDLHQILMMKRQDIYSRLCFTEFNGRLLMSGTFRDWYTLAWYMKTHGSRTAIWQWRWNRCGFYTINQHIGNVLDGFLDESKQSKRANIKLVQPESLTGRESMVHLRPTVHFIVSRDVSREFLKFREASIEEVPAPLPPIDPLFFGGGPGEPAVDKHLDAALAWEALRDQAKKAYDRFMELGMKNETGVPLLSAFSVVPGSVGTELYMTANLGHWEQIFKKSEVHACYEVNDIMAQVSQEMHEKYPCMIADSQ